jgi:hypothetical protein
MRRESHVRFCERLGGNSWPTRPIDVWALFERTEYSLDLLASGSLWRMSRPLKLKAIGACLSAFELPDLGLLGLFAGAHRRRFSLLPG